MSDVKIEDLSPVPFFAHFLEGQFCKELTAEQMKSVRGGYIVTASALEGVPAGELPDIHEMLRGIERLGDVPRNLPGHQVTLAYPSDGETAQF